MAKTLIVQLTCDRCTAEKNETVEGTESVNFAFDGYQYNLDLCKDHAADFHNTVQGLIGWSSDRSRVDSRRSRRQASADGAGPGEQPKAAGRSTADRDRLKAIRGWARENGYPDLGDRGRIPQAIVDAYEAAN